jgi:hypothetical protein
MALSCAASFQDLPDGYRLRNLAYELSIQEGGPGGPLHVPDKVVLKRLEMSPADTRFSDLMWYLLSGGHVYMA